MVVDNGIGISERRLSTEMEVDVRPRLLSVFAALLIAIQVFAPLRAGHATRIADTKNETVYITRTGKKFHRDGCRSLNRSRIPIKRSDAISKGYQACKVCRP